MLPAELFLAGSVQQDWWKSMLTIDFPSPLFTTFNTIASVQKGKFVWNLILLQIYEHMNDLTPVIFGNIDIKIWLLIFDIFVFNLIICPILQFHPLKFRLLTFLVSKFLPFNYFWLFSHQPYSSRLQESQHSSTACAKIKCSSIIQTGLF